MTEIQGKGGFGMNNRFPFAKAHVRNFQVNVEDVSRGKRWSGGPKKLRFNVVPKTIFLYHCRSGIPGTIPIIMRAFYGTKTKQESSSTKSQASGHH